MKVVVVGAGGMLGSDVVDELNSTIIEVAAFTKKELDITNFQESFKKLASIKPDYIINCAAFTDVDGAESNQSLALSVNALGVRNLSLIAREINAILVQISTDFVFDGNKKAPYGIYDQPNPINYYGYSKYIGERFVTSLCPTYYLIRTSWLFGEQGKNFVKSILEAVKTKDFLTVVNDQLGKPTYSKDLASAIIKLIKTPFPGIYHITNQGEASWYDFAYRIIDIADIDIEVRPIMTKDINRLAKRPFDSRLDPFPLEETIKELLPPWEDALNRYLNQ